MERDVAGGAVVCVPRREPHMECKKPVWDCKRCLAKCVGFGGSNGGLQKFVVKEWVGDLGPKALI